MDADGLPLVGPGIDYTKVEAINQKRTIAFINHFVTHTARFLNRFSCVCEEKLENLSGRLQQLEISLNILEAKISSIPGLESVTAPQSSTSSSAPPANAPASSTDASQAAAPPPPPPGQGAPAAAAAPTEVQAAPEPAPEPVAQNKVSDDPRFVKFFKMLKYGAAAEAIKLKMTQEGLNPDYLDDPDAPAPEGGAPPPPPAQDSDDSDENSSASDFSD